MTNFFKMINFKIKENKYIILLILLALLLISGWFYWYEIRPAKIRQDCSWVKHTDEAIPARPAMSEEELKAKGFIKDCAKEELKFYGEFSTYQSIFAGKEGCERSNKQIVEEYKTARPAVLAKDWYSKAPEKVYDFCIKSRGITR